ncbi:PQQ-dependent sugar dehydrogenase, partial [Micromonospora zhanjiangensis]
MSNSDDRRTLRRRLTATGATLLLVATAAGTAALGPAVPAAAHPITAVDFQQVELARGVAETGEPMSLAVLPDRSVLQTARDGTLRRTDAAGSTAVVGRLAVYNHDEEGLQGVGVDPNFASNRFIYLYHAPPLSTPAGDAPATGTDWSAWQGVNRLSRFTLKADWTLDPGSQVTVLDVPADRGICCHVGGDIDFDAAGNLYLSTGDDSNPFDSAGYAPIDERTNRNPAYDAQRSAGNTNDLRGKILRIKVNADGSYSIPAGNLFPPGTAKTRPEIYAMGFRNPFRMSVDKATGVVYVGDYGPDAGSSDPGRGPSGQVEFDRVTGPGNYGWPYCTGTNTAAETYNEWTFPNGPSGAKYDCAGGPTNNSFRNTGQGTLPPARPAWIRYGGDVGSPPEFGGGSESPMAGPVYRYDPNLNSSTKFPQSFDGQFFATEFGRGWIKPIHLTGDGSPGTIDSFPWAGKQVMDSAFGPDGAYYVLDYGTGYFNGDANSALYRFDYVGGSNRAPTARAAGTPTSGTAPLTVAFSSAGSTDPEGGALTYRWAFGDGGTSTAANPSHTFTANGTYTATLTVTDPAGATGSAGVVITVGNTAPTVTIGAPGNGQLFSFGDSVPFQITVTDPEDRTIDCAKVKMTYVLGHDQHGHQITSKNGCSGSLDIPVDGEHDSAANIFAVFDAEYTDAGGLTTHAQHTLQPRHRQAEHFRTSAGINTFDKTPAEGGKTVGDIHNGDWIAFEPYRLGDVTSFSARVSSSSSGGTVQVRSGSPTGAVLGSATVPVTGGWDVFTDVTDAVSGAPAGTTTLYLTFANPATTGALFDLDAFTLVTGGGGGGTGPVVGLAGKCLDVAGAGTADGTKVQL